MQYVKLNVKPQNPNPPPAMTPELKTVHGWTLVRNKEERDALHRKGATRIPFPANLEYPLFINNFPKNASYCEILLPAELRDMLAALEGKQ